MNNLYIFHIIMSTAFMHQFSSHSRNRTSHKLCCFDPFRNRYSGILHSLNIRLPVSHAPHQFWNLRNKGVIFDAPVKNDVVFLCHLPSTTLISLSVKPYNPYTAVSIALFTPSICLAIIIFTCWFGSNTSFCLSSIIFFHKRDKMVMFGLINLFG